MAAPALDQVVVIGPNDRNVLAWPITSRMGDNAWYHGDDAGTLDCPHSKSGIWPQWMLTPDQPDPTPAEGNVWGIFQWQGQWYARTLHYLRPAQTRKLFPRAEWATDKENWPIDRAWPGPQRGDLLGLFVSTRARYGHSQTQERSDVVWVRYGLPGLVAREGEQPMPDEPEPGEPPTPVPGDCPAAPLPSDVDWPHRIEAKLDQIVSLLDSAQARGGELVTAVSTSSAALQGELQKGLKIRWR